MVTTKAPFMDTRFEVLIIKVIKSSSQNVFF